ncbi:hypothetical protein [Eubacterium oxidoreducens]|uniref:Uncharacterized protein n=1 Tax=Eubacterium oxidoreducens TaxID=1732 RepID=A0A1G6A0Q1_EUBOX|nr:hypothetical protein [Eubacterium oxidoreducens]SDB01890.1 hypothetical protein SAMN02910417_00103 [Eubacterium oxidoreducens]
MNAANNNNDNLTLANWKLDGLRTICSALQTSEQFEEEQQNLFFVISEELNNISQLLKKTE